VFYDVKGRAVFASFEGLIIFFAQVLQKFLHRLEIKILPISAGRTPFGHWADEYWGNFA
jgi:hypothetical protein